jgi:iron(III) transport system ATP-binding protein
VASSDEKLSFEGVGRRYGPSFALRGFSLAVRRGELLCLLGPSGSGKTTALRLAAGLERLSTGCIRIDGELVSAASVHVPPERRGVGLIFQDFALFPHLTVAANVAFGLLQLAKPERARRTAAALERVGLSALAGSYPHSLSGGEQQRVALARALAPTPRILLMDEPFSGLDPSLRNSVREDTVRLLKSLGTTVVLVTHDPEEAMRVADRIALMRAGALVQLGTPLELYRSPVDQAAAAFFGAVNVLHGIVRGGKAATPLGLFAAQALAEGTEVEALVRPQALRLGAPGSGSPAEVLSVRALGAETEILLALKGGVCSGGAALVLKARQTSTAAPKEGSTVYVSVEQGAAHVVPCAKQPTPVAKNAEARDVERSVQA